MAHLRRHLRDRRGVAAVTALSLALLAWNNAVVTRLPGGAASYVPGNLAAAALLLAAARRSGLSWDELGLAPRRLGAGARWGGVAAGAVAAGYAVALALPAARPLLADARVAGLDADALVTRALLRIPLGTVLWEEVAFRGVLLAALVRLLPTPAAVGVAAAVFGAWHARPTLSAVTANDLAAGPVATAGVVLAGCAATALAGVALAWLRLRSGSLLAPVLLHTAANVLGLLAAAAAGRG